MIDVCVGTLLDELKAFAKDFATVDISEELPLPIFEISTRWTPFLHLVDDLVEYVPFLENECAPLPAIAQTQLPDWPLHHHEAGATRRLRPHSP